MTLREPPGPAHPGPASAHDASSVDARRLALCVLGAIGAAVYLLVFATSLRSPERLEQYAAEFIEAKATEVLEHRVDGWTRGDGETALGRLAEDLLARTESSSERLREDLRNRVHEQIADAIAEMRDLDCACRDAWADMLRDRATSRLERLEAETLPLRRTVHATYARIVADLAQDVRIFSGVNAIAFLLLLAAALARPRAVLQLFVPGLMLGTAAIICSYFYVFEQNWLLTVIYESYVGLWYFLWLALVFAALLDIALNKARITTEVVNSVFSAVGYLPSAVPC